MLRAVRYRHNKEISITFAAYNSERKVNIILGASRVYQVELDKRNKEKTAEESAEEETDLGKGVRCSLDDPLRWESSNGQGQGQGLQSCPNHMVRIRYS